MATVLPFTAGYCAYGLAMPNLKPRPIRTAKDVIWYRRKMDLILRSDPNRRLFTPLLTIEINDDTTPDIIFAARDAGAVAGKIYPRGIYGEGLTDFFSWHTIENFRAMQECGMLCLFHGELDRPRMLYIERESAFLPTFCRLAEKLPALKMVLEHVSTKEGIKLVERLGSNAAATITGHHPLLTLNECRLNPHNMCNPTPKDFDDKDAIIEAMTGGNPNFFLGSDTAPHLIHRKECDDIDCGVFSAPVLPAVLAGIFVATGAGFAKMQNFTSTFPARFYGLPLVRDTISFIKEDWMVPKCIGGIVPFMAGQVLPYKLV